MAVRAAAQQLPPHAGLPAPPPGGPPRAAAAPPRLALQRRTAAARQPLSAGGRPAGPPRSAPGRRLRASQHRGRALTYSRPPPGRSGSDADSDAAPPRGSAQPRARLPLPGAVPPLRAAAPCRCSVPPPRRRGLAGRLYLFTIRSVFFLSGARLQRIAWPKGCGPRGSLTGAEPPRTDARPAPTLSALRRGTTSRGRAREESGERLAPHLRRRPTPTGGAHPHTPTYTLRHSPCPAARGCADGGTAAPGPARPPNARPLCTVAARRSAPRRVSPCRPLPSIGQSGPVRPRGRLVWLGARGELFCSPAIHEPLLRSVLCVAALPTVLRATGTQTA